MAAGDLQPGLHGQGGQGGQLGLPRPGPVAVGAARVRGDQQPPGCRVVAAAGRLPPAADRLYGERGGVMVGAHVHPAGIRRHVINTVGDALAHAVNGEVMRAGGRGLVLGAPLPARVGELTDELLFLGIHADHRVPGALMVLDLLADVPELRVPVRAARSLEGLALPCRLNPAAGSRSPTVSAPTLWPWRVSSSARLRLRRPPQWRHRIAPLLRLDQGQQRRAQAPDPGRPPACGPARLAGPAQRLGAGVQLIHSQGHRRLADPGGPGHQPDPAMAERAGLRAQQQQQPPLPLIQVREDRRELRRQDLPCFLVAARTTSACRIPGSYGLFFGKPLTSRLCSANRCAVQRCLVHS